MLFGETLPICCVNYTKYRDTVWTMLQKFLALKWVVYIAKTVL